ncbi:hypothetical protein, partial [Rhizobium rhizoryzae]|uniref:hypothetical protein n=1 Tax=Rhizobium rhizoryzae TaxID=451876 RepID=UPI0028A78F33
RMLRILNGGNDSILTDTGGGKDSETEHGDLLTIFGLPYEPHETDAIAVRTSIQSIYFRDPP